MPRRVRRPQQVEVLPPSVRRTPPPNHDDPVSQVEHHTLADKVRLLEARERRGKSLEAVVNNDPDVDDSYQERWDGIVAGLLIAEGIRIAQGLDEDNRITWVDELTQEIAAEIESYGQDIGLNLIALRAIQKVGATVSAFVSAKDYNEVPRSWAGGTISSADTSSAELAAADDADPDGRRRATVSAHYNPSTDQSWAQVELTDDLDVDTTKFLLTSDGGSDFLKLKSFGDWEIEFLWRSVNIPSTASGSSATYEITGVTGLDVDDICVMVGHDDQVNLRRFILNVRPLVTLAGRIEIDYFNAGATTQDPAAVNFFFLIIHRGDAA